MKKVAVVIMALVSLFAVSAYAETLTYTASVNFTGITGVTSISIALKNFAGGNATSFSFPASAAALGKGTTFYVANEYAVIFTTWTSGSNGRLLVYTDNVDVSADPRYTGTADPAGLVCSTGTISNSKPLDLAWRVTDASTSTVCANFLQDGTTMHLYANGMPSNYYNFIWMRDRGSSTNWYANSSFDYSTIKRFSDAGQLIQHGENTFGATSSPDYFYLNCNTENARGGLSYRTNTLRFELRND